MIGFVEIGRMATNGASNEFIAELRSASNMEEQQLQTERRERRQRRR